MNINIKNLMKDTETLGNAIYDGISRDRIVKEFAVLMGFNSILQNLANLYLNPDVILQKYPNLKEFIIRETEKSLTNFYMKIIKEEDLYREIFRNHVIQCSETDLEMVSIGTKLRKYTEKDAKEILYSYFSQYGDRPYKIVKKYFDEERIQMSYNPDNSPAIAFFTGSVLLEKGYICLQHDCFNSSALSYLSHEFGHVIDKEYFYNPQQKKIRVYDDPFNEIPSSFFDWGILDYLIDNKIDERGALSIKTFYYDQMFYRNLLLFKLIDTETFSSDEINVGEDFRSLFLYGNGYHTSLAMNELARENRKEYMKYYNNFICSRNELDFIDLLEVANIDVDEFVNGIILKREIDKTTNALKKKYNIKE